MKWLLRKLTDWAVLPFVRYVLDRIPPRYTITAEIQRRVSSECADYVQTKMQKAVAFATKSALWDHALTKIDADGLYAEFGVFRGESINQIARKRQNVIIYGFDSFEGLKEDWTGHDCVKGAFDLSGKLPRVAANVHLIKGWFDKTIPEFLGQHSAPFAFIHCDCDTYEATATVLKLIRSRIQQGTVIVFDEYFGYRGWRLGEFKAWQEMVSSSGIVYEYLGFRDPAFEGCQVSIRVLSSQ
jgi:hypothetical protein